MDKHLNNDELKLQALLDAKNFDELSQNEKELVLLFLSEKEYIFQRKIIIESTQLHQEKTIVAPPFIMKSAATNSFWFKKAPVYQSLLAVAATVILMFFITRNENSIIEKEIVTEYVTQVDTIIETKIVNDTLVKYIDKPVIVETIKYVEVPAKEGVVSNVNYASSNEEGRVLEPSMNVRLPDLNETKSSSSSNSFKNDPTSILVQDFVLNK